MIALFTSGAGRSMWEMPFSADVYMKTFFRLSSSKSAHDGSSCDAGKLLHALVVAACCCCWEMSMARANCSIYRSHFCDFHFAQFLGKFFIDPRRICSEGSLVEKDFIRALHNETIQSLQGKVVCIRFGGVACFTPLCFIKNRPMIGKKRFLFDEKGALAFATKWRQVLLVSEDFKRQQSINYSHFTPF